MLATENMVDNRFLEVRCGDGDFPSWDTPVWKGGQATTNH